jgi:hypothetical protein
VRVGAACEVGAGTGSGGRGDTSPTLTAMGPS